MELARINDAIQAADSPVSTYLWEGEKLKPQTVPEWVAAILQKAGMRLISCVDRMCDLKWESHKAGLPVSIDVSISDSDHIAAFQNHTCELVSNHVPHLRSAVIHIAQGRHSDMTIMMPLETDDVKVNAKRVITEIAHQLLNRGVVLENRPVCLGAEVRHLLDLSL